MKHFLLNFNLVFNYSYYIKPSKSRSSLQTKTHSHIILPGVYLETSHFANTVQHIVHHAGSLLQVVVQIRLHGNNTQDNGLLTVGVYGSLTLRTAGGSEH